MIALQAAFQVWDSVTHDGERFDHGVTGVLVVPEPVAWPLLHNAGYRKATAADIGAELAWLEARIATLRSLSS